MARHALKLCYCTSCPAHPGTCPELVASGRCRDCAAAADRARGSATQRGYKTPGHAAFRAAVLNRDPTCVRCKAAPSTVADHYPISRRDLVAAGLDPNDPARGRGLCASCHGSETVRHQPGGFNLRTH